jgi:tetratricopeptide (TPR) repeat protein
MNSEHKEVSVPGLQELFGQLLGQRVRAVAAGFVSERLPEVVPYEAVPPLAIDAGLAWTEALEAGNAFGLATPSFECPTGWADLVVNAAPISAVPMCLGNFPQLVRDIKALAEVANLPSLRPQPPATSIDATGVRNWRSSDPSAAVTFVRAGVLRLAGEYAEASRMLAELPERRGKLKTALLNERAALAWHQGEHERAIDLWNGAREDTPVLFNRAMSLLFSRQAAESRPLFDRALAELPASSGWRQLAELYLAVAELKG